VNEDSRATYYAFLCDYAGGLQIAWRAQASLASGGWLGEGKI